MDSVLKECIKEIITNSTTSRDDITNVIIKLYAPSTLSELSQEYGITLEDIVDNMEEQIHDYFKT